MSRPCENSVKCSELISSHKKRRLHASRNPVKLDPSCLGRVDRLISRQLHPRRHQLLSPTSLSPIAWHRTAIRHDRRAHFLHRIPTLRHPCQPTRIPPRTTMDKPPKPTAHRPPVPTSHYPLSIFPPYAQLTVDPSRSRVNRAHSIKRRRSSNSNSNSTRSANPKLLPHFHRP